jgi:MFS family permease
MRSRDQRWWVVAALFTVTFTLAIPFAAFGVFLPALAQEFGWSRGAISVALSINLLLGGAAGFAVGALADRYGPRALLAGTAALAGTGFALTSLVHALWHIYLLVGVLGGIGMSAFYVLSTSTVARWFEQRRGLAIGIVLTGFNLGFVAGGPAAAWLIEHVGWRTAYVTLGGSAGLVGAVAALGVRYPAPAAASLGIRYPAPAAAVLDRARPALIPVRSLQRESGASLREAMVDPRLWYLNVSWFLMGMVLTTLSVHVVPYARDHGIDLERAALALTSYGLGSVVGRLVFGPAADRLGTTSAIRLGFAIQIIALAALVTTPSAQWLPPLMMAYGIGFAGADTAIVRVIPDVFGLRALGAIMGVLSLGWRCGAALGPAATGFVYDATRSYALSFGAAPVLLVVSVLLVTAATSARQK